MKTCKKCKIEKPLTAFYADKNSKDGKRLDCAKCKDASTYLWRATNKDYYNKTMREYHKKMYGTERLYRYNLAREDYEKMLLLQENKCAVCKKLNPSKKRALAIDHCHKTGKVRGLLCYKCNRDMVVIDDVDQLNKLIEYRNGKKSF